MKEPFIDAVTNIYCFENLPEFLKKELACRKSRNPRYSLRAFARDLDISFSRLSEYLRDNDGMNASTAAKISSKLQLSDNEKEYLNLMVTASSGRTATIREAAATKMKKIRGKMEFMVLKSGFSGLFSQWYYIPLIEIISLSTNRSLQTTADCLGISVTEVTTAIKQLEAAGYVTALSENEWRKSTPFLQIESSTPQPAIRKYHKKVIEAGAKALQQPINQRKFLSTVLGIRKDSVEDARKDIESFNREFVAKYAAEKGADAVYGMNVQFFEYDNLRS